ncbi:MAG TPA: TlpA disulfide reductase family protein [Candidatus Acidoferrales bacterium]|nr:TlpA disulfide reductase family protein [Candidatus Acidoferrales bacterium]
MPRYRFAFALLFLYSGWAAAQQPSGLSETGPIETGPAGAGPSAAAKAISEQLRQLRSLPDDARAGVTKRLGLQIRQLPSGSRLGLASQLASLATEGDFGRDTLQEVTTTLELALRELPLRAGQRKPDEPYVELANLARYERMQVGLSDPQYAAALAKLESDDLARRDADFTLADLEGKQWTLKGLRGSVVLVNFWATWCPPCRKEIPDLDALYKRFKDQGLVILAISDEEAGKVKPFVAQQKSGYPVLLDAGGSVNKLFRVEGIPKTFVYDREGKLAAQSIDMRTMKQFLEMLQQAGLR